MTSIEGEQHAGDAGSAKDPVAGQDKTAPKIDPSDGKAVDDLAKERQPETGPKN